MLAINAEGSESPIDCGKHQGNINGGSDEKEESSQIGEKTQEICYSLMASASQSHKGHQNRSQEGRAVNKLYIIHRNEAMFNDLKTTSYPIF
jgi:hypothetical protein